MKTKRTKGRVARLLKAERELQIDFLKKEVVKQREELRVCHEALNFAQKRTEQIQEKNIRFRWHLAGAVNAAFPDFTPVERYEQIWPLLTEHQEPGSVFAKESPLTRRIRGCWQHAVKVREAVGFDQPIPFKDVRTAIRFQRTIADVAAQAYQDVFKDNTTLKLRLASAEERHTKMVKEWAVQFKLVNDYEGGYCSLGTSFHLLWKGITRRFYHARYRVCCWRDCIANRIDSVVNRVASWYSHAEPIGAGHPCFDFVTRTTLELADPEIGAKCSVVRYGDAGQPPVWIIEDKPTTTSTATSPKLCTCKSTTAPDPDCHGGSLHS